MQASDRPSHLTHPLRGCKRSEDLDDGGFRLRALHPRPDGWCALFLDSLGAVPTRPHALVAGLLAWKGRPKWLVRCRLLRINLGPGQRVCMNVPANRSSAAGSYESTWVWVMGRRLLRIKLGPGQRKGNQPGSGSWRGGQWLVRCRRLRINLGPGRKAAGSYESTWVWAIALAPTNQPGSGSSSSGPYESTWVWVMATHPLHGCKRSDDLDDDGFRLRALHPRPDEWCASSWTRRAPPDPHPRPCGWPTGMEGAANGSSAAGS
jgi:hypothetical protein